MAIKEQQIPGTLFIVAAPSGAGKTSLVEAVVKQLAQIVVSVSYTTRDKRPGEIEGLNYFFINEAKFKQMAEEDRFLEYAQVFGAYYGTSRDWVMQQLQSGYDVIVEIDWQGAQQLRQILAQQTASIFILPPSLATLQQRLRQRGQDDQTTIARRMELARDEMGHWGEFEYLIINDYFDDSVQQLRSIILANLLRRESHLPRWSNPTRCCFKRQSE